MRVVATALPGRDLPFNEGLDNLLNTSGNPKEDIDMIRAEQVDGPRPHAPCEDMGYFLFCKKGGKPAGFMTGIGEILAHDNA